MVLVCCIILLQSLSFVNSIPLLKILCCTSRGKVVQSNVQFLVGSWAFGSGLFSSWGVVSGPLMEKHSQRGVIEKGQTCMYYLFPTSIVMLTNANERSKPGLCSAKHSFKCCLLCDYVMGRKHICLWQLSKKNWDIWILRKVHLVKIYTWKKRVRL